MSSEFGLSIGESFAELLGIAAGPEGTADTADKASKPRTYQARWYLPKKNLTDGLREAFRAANEAGVSTAGARMTVASQSVERTLNKGQGRSPAVLVTTGFESWLRLKQPFTSPQFALSPQRSPLLVEKDSVFAVGGRLNSDGTIQTALPMDELEFLAAKLEMQKVKDIAIAFLHSQKNPEQENDAADFLRGKGFRVFVSYSQPGATDIERWQSTIEHAYAESAIIEEKTQIEAAIKNDTKSDTEEEAPIELNFWSERGPLAWTEYTASHIRRGLRSAMAAAVYEAQAATSKPGWTLHCGLDELLLFGPARHLEALNIHPTQLVRHGMWAFPHFADDFSGLEPGPMLFGKSHQLAALDVLFVRDRLRDIDGFTTLLSERSRPRILESLFTLGKSHLPPNSSQRPPDALVIAEDLERAFLERINACLAFSGVTGEVRMTGPLAETLTPLLKERRPDLKFRFDKTQGWAEARACAGSSKVSKSEAR